MVRHHSHSVYCIPPAPPVNKCFRSGEMPNCSEHEIWTSRFIHFWMVTYPPASLTERIICIYCLLSVAAQGRGESLPAAHLVVRRRFSGTLLLPPLRRRHSCQEHQWESRQVPAAHAVHALDRLEGLYRQALASRDEHWSVESFSFFLSFFLGPLVVSCSAGHTSIEHV